jgi:hypothetical protein
MNDIISHAINLMDISDDIDITSTQTILNYWIKNTEFSEKVGAGFPRPRYLNNRETRPLHSLKTPRYLQVV